MLSRDVVLYRWGLGVVWVKGRWAVVKGMGVKVVWSSGRGQEGCWFRVVGVWGDRLWVQEL